MKKIISIAIPIIVTIVVLFLIKTVYFTPITGTYKFESITIKENGEKVTVYAGQEYEGSIMYEDDFVYTVNDDKTFVMHAKISGEEIERNGSLEQSGSIYYMHINGIEQTEKSVVTFDGNKLIIKNSLVEMVLKK